MPLVIFSLNILHLISLNLQRLFLLSCSNLLVIHSSSFCLYILVSHCFLLLLMLSKCFVWLVSRWNLFEWFSCSWINHRNLINGGNSWSLFNWVRLNAMLLLYWLLDFIFHFVSIFRKLTWLISAYFLFSFL